MWRTLALPHLILGAYCAGLCTVLAARPPTWLLILGALVALSGLVAGPALLGSGADGRAAVLVPAVALSALFLVAGAAVGEQRLAAVQRSELRPLVGHEVALQAVLTDLPAVADDQVTLAVRVVSADGRLCSEPAHLKLKLEQGARCELDSCGPLTEGAQLVVASASIEPLPRAKPGKFDYGRYLRRRGEHVLLAADFGEVRLRGRRGGLQGLIDRLRRASRAHLRAGVHPPVSEVLQGMVLGDDEGVDQQSIDDFRRSGLLHIMAVSGENVVLLCGMWSFALALLGVPRMARTLLLLPTVATYVVLTGASPSIVRAGVAGVVGLLAVLVSRPSDGWLLWLAPAAWLLTVNPNNLFDASFQLSFGAVLGLLLLARPVTHALAFLPGPLPEQVGVTTAASISTAPISMLTFGSASVVSVPANVAGGFVLGPIMFSGMLSLLLGFVSPWLSLPLNLVSGLFIGFLLDVARVFGRLSWATYEWQGLSLRLLLVLALAAEAATLLALARRRGLGLPAFLRLPHMRLPLVAVTAVVVAATLLLAPAGPAAPTRPTLTLLSVGEGAAALFQAPGGPTVLIDAGPGPLASTLRAHAVRRIDLLVMSHGHADHAAGLADVLGRVPVRLALLPRPPAGDGADSLLRLAAELRDAKVPVRWVDAPIRVSGGGWEIRVLPTKAVAGESGNQDENDHALVVLAGLGGREVLVPGDAEGEVLTRLALPRCAMVELPHHGSRGGLDQAQLAQLAPHVAAISVGDNTYGHPTPEMLALLAGAGIPCLRTDKCGDIAVTAGVGELDVRVAHDAP
jgi:competence protein ComEC